MSNPAWYVAKAMGRDTKAAFYLRRSGVRVFRPETHHYFIDKRTQQENFRVSAVFPGYIFFECYGQTEYNNAASSIGVAYVLGNWTEDRFNPKEMPIEWIEQLIESCPIIEGKRKKFCTGESVRVVINGISEIIATVESHTKKIVIVRAHMFGSEMNFPVHEDKIEAVQ